MKRLIERYNDFCKVLLKLEDVLTLELTGDYIYDAAIQRFEFTYELSWKFLKSYLFFQGISETNTPRETFKEAFAAGIIKDGGTWIKMLEDRNITSHTYNEEAAREVYFHIKDKYLDLFRNLRESAKGVLEI